MRLHLAAATLATVLATLLAPTVRAGQNPTSTMLLSQASRYVARFVDRFTNVVAEEHYVQDWKTTAGVPLLHRESKADFLLTRVANTDSWQALRDVFEVNGGAIRDREDRMTRLFAQPSAETAKQVDAIAAESARYNISNVQRTVNHPLFVLVFLQPEMQKRFAYSVDKMDRAAGANVWVVEYKETVRPTLIRGTKGDLPARGRIWIQASTGAVLRTELELEDNLQSSRIGATFREGERFAGSDVILDINLPVEMEEQYTVKGNAGKISAKATYTKFRQFTVDTKEQLK